jgi:hypothetical protein
MTRPVDRTHGRWPWLAAAGAVPATAICVARRDRLAKDAAWALWGSLPASSGTRRALMRRRVRSEPASE